MAATIARVSCPSFLSRHPSSFWGGTPWTECITLHTACTLWQASLTSLKPTIHYLYSFAPLLPLLTIHGACSVAALFPLKQAFLTCDGSHAVALFEAVTSYAWLPLDLTLILSSALLHVPVVLLQHTHSLSPTRSVCSCSVSGSKCSTLCQPSFTGSRTCVLTYPTSMYILLGIHYKWFDHSWFYSLLHISAQELELQKDNYKVLVLKGCFSSTAVKTPTFLLPKKV